MCSECGWQSALRITGQLRSWKLAFIDRWVERHRCISDPQWKAIVKVARKLNHDIPPGTIPEWMSEPEPTAAELLTLPEVIEDGDNLKFCE